MGVWSCFELSQMRKCWLLLGRKGIVIKFHRRTESALKISFDKSTPKSLWVDMLLRQNCIENEFYGASTILSDMRCPIYWTMKQQLDNKQSLHFIIYWVYGKSIGNLLFLMEYWPYWKTELRYVNDVFLRLPHSRPVNFHFQVQYAISTVYVREFTMYCPYHTNTSQQRFGS